MHKWVNDSTCVNLFPHRTAPVVVSFHFWYLYLKRTYGADHKPNTHLPVYHCLSEMVSIAFDIVPSTHYNKYTQTNIIITKRKMAQIFYNHKKKTIKNEQRTQKLMNTKMWSIFRQWITQCHFTRSQLIYNIVNNIVIKFIVWPA